MNRRLPPNWRKRIELIHRNDEFENAFEIRFKKGQTPKGFFRSIGNLDIEIYDGEAWVESADVEDHFRNRGLGTMMYEAAMNKFGALHTKYHDSSVSARWLWQSLTCKHLYKADFFSGQLTIFRGK
jgi:hypothetical protein